MTKHRAVPTPRARCRLSSQRIAYRAQPIMKLAKTIQKIKVNLE
jgi:hypothetical protein